MTISKINIAQYMDIARRLPRRPTSPYDRPPNNSKLLKCKSTKTKQQGIDTSKNNNNKFKNK